MSALAASVTRSKAAAVCGSADAAAGAATPGFFCVPAASQSNYTQITTHSTLQGQVKITERLDQI